MTTLFELQGVEYELQGYYRLPCVALPNEKENVTKKSKATSPMDWG